MKNISLVLSHVRGDTKDVNRRPETKVLVDRPRFSPYRRDNEITNPIYNHEI